MNNVAECVIQHKKSQKTGPQLLQDNNKIGFFSQCKIKKKEKGKRSVHAYSRKHSCKRRENKYIYIVLNQNLQKIRMKLEIFKTETTIFICLD